MFKHIALNIFAAVALILSLGFSRSSLAHEGHDHGVPGSVQAPKGGVIRSLEEIHLELLTKGNKILIYVYGHDMKPSKTTKYPLKATVALPRKKAESLSLKAEENHWEAEFDAKGSHRYELVLSVNQSGHEDKVKFNVEPKK